jgi:hypothetical protein
MNSEQRLGWTILLQKEYESLLKKYALNLTPARLAIAENPETLLLGKWVKDLRLIEINPRVVQEGSWSEVIHVLKHEMAHQMVDELFAISQSPHGDCFRHCCQQLEISHQTKLLFQKDGKATPIQRKISKLLALSSSSNQHEAEAALNKAQELSLLHNISEIANKSNRYSLRPLGAIRKRRSRSEGQVLSILHEFYFVLPLLNTRGEFGWQFEIYGTLENLDSAEYVYDFLLNNAESLWHSYKVNSVRDVARKKEQYLKGLYAGLYQKLRLQKEELMNRYALKKIVDPELLEFYKDLNPRTRKVTTRSQADPGVYNDGVAKGRTLQIRAGVSTKKSSGIRGYIS